MYEATSIGKTPVNKNWPKNKTINQIKRSYFLHFAFAQQMDWENTSKQELAKE